MTNLEYGRNNKGGQTLIYKGFEFNRHRETASGTIHWHCSKFISLNCRSILHTKDNKIIREPSEHSHVNKICEVATHKLSNEMKINMSCHGATARTVMQIFSVFTSNYLEIS